MKDFLLFSGSSNQPLAHSIAKILGISLGRVDLSRFADGESRPWIDEDVRDKTVFVLQSLSYPMDEHTMEMALMGDAIRRSAPKTMIAVIPYMGYARQDRQHRVGEPVSARVIAKILEVSKFKEVITIDLHNDAVVGFFQVPVTHISAKNILAEELKKMHIKNAVIISPDVGGVKRARDFAYTTDLPMVVMEKKRYLDRRDVSEAYEIIGDVKGKAAVIVDDVISTGSTIVHSVQSLRDAGAKSVIVLVTHGVLAGSAIKNLSRAPIDKLILTDTILLPKEKYFPHLAITSVASILADAIASIVR